MGSAGKSRHHDHAKLDRWGCAVKLTPIIPDQTDWRRLDASYLLNGWKFGSVNHILIKREGDLVYLQIPGLSLNGSDATSNLFILLPQGFVAHTGGNYGTIGYVNDSSASGPVAIKKDFSHLTTDSRGNLSGILIFRTKHAMPHPTTWPGIPDY